MLAIINLCAHHDEQQHRPMYMEGGRKVVLKLGGGLLTNKKGVCSPNIEAIEKSARTIAELIYQGCKIALVHGAGSYGHAKAKKWRLTEGRIDDLFSPDGETKTQEQAVEQVRSDMKELNQLLTSEFTNLDVDFNVFHPHLWASGTGPEFSGDLSFLDSDVLTIVHGDVVDDPIQGFGILSGDDLMFRIATEWRDVDSCVFALADCDGIMSHPPDNPNSILIPYWDMSMGFGGKHDSEHDVTGGIEYKAIRAAQISETVSNVWFVDGTRPERVFDACIGSESVGTRILSNPVRL